MVLSSRASPLLRQHAAAAGGGGGGSGGGDTGAGLGVGAECRGFGGGAAVGVGAMMPGLPPEFIFGPAGTVQEGGIYRIEQNVCRV